MSHYKEAIVINFRFFELNNSNTNNNLEFSYINFPEVLLRIFELFLLNKCFPNGHPFYLNIVKDSQKECFQITSQCPLLKQIGFKTDKSSFSQFVSRRGVTLFRRKKDGYSK